MKGLAIEETQEVIQSYEKLIGEMRSGIEKAEARLADMRTNVTGPAMQAGIDAMESIIETQRKALETLLKGAENARLRYRQMLHPGETIN